MCLERALEAEYPKKEAVDLCQGALSVLPYDCAALATDTKKRFKRSQVIDLCRGATSPDVHNCATKATKLGYLPALVVMLCSEVL